MRDRGADDTLVVAAYEEHRGALLRWLVARTRDQGKAEDLCHEAFIRLLREVRDGRPPDRVGAWLHRVAFNLLVSRARRDSVAARHCPRAADVDDGEEVIARILARERLRAVDAAIRRLSADERPLLMQAAAGSKGAALAERIGCTPGAARTRLHRARRHLRAELVCHRER